jgi:hypothetical protein
MLQPYVAHMTRAMLTVAAMFLTTAASAQTPDPYQGRDEWNPTDVEVAQLPPYCQVDLRPQVFRGTGTRGYACGDRFNHFCPGLAAMNRAMNPMLPKTTRRYNLQLAWDHLRYTRKNMAPTCRLATDLQAAEQQVQMLHTLIK